MRVIWILALLAGCAALEWKHPTASQAELNQDWQACEYEAMKATAGAPGAAHSFGAAYELEKRKSEITSACMKMRGYRQG